MSLFLEILCSLKCTISFSNPWTFRYLRTSLKTPLFCEICKYHACNKSIWSDNQGLNRNNNVYYLENVMEMSETVTIPSPFMTLFLLPIKAQGCVESGRKSSLILTTILEEEKSHLNTHWIQWNWIHLNKELMCSAFFIEVIQIYTFIWVFISGLIAFHFCLHQELPVYMYFEKCSIFLYHLFFIYLFAYRIPACTSQ